MIINIYRYVYTIYIYYIYMNIVLINTCYAIKSYLTSKSQRFVFNKNYSHLEVQKDPSSMPLSSRVVANDWAHVFVFDVAPGGWDTSSQF